MISFKGGKNGKHYTVEDNCPQEVIDLFISQKDTITFEFYKRYRKFFPNTKRFKVTGLCEKCSKPTKLFILQLTRRTLKELKHKMICKNCIRKSVGANLEWQESNRKSQKIAQNRPETLQKNKNSVKKAWSDPKRRKSWCQSIKKSNQSLNKRQKSSKTLKEKFKNDEVYREKCLSNWSFKGISGVFKSKINGEIRFDSSFELCYLIECDLKKIKTKRLKIRLQYVLNNETKYYRPDFLEEEKIVKEIKSSYVRDNLQTKEELKQKKKAALLFCRQNNYRFRLITEKEIFFLKPKKFIVYLLEIFEKNNSIVLDNKRENHIVKTNPFYLKSQKVFEKWNLLK
jgi:hypothetical protein